MTRKIPVILSTILVVLLAGALVTAAQNEAGTISGTVYRTENPNSTCTETGLPGEGNIPLQFVNRNNNTTINQRTNSDGSYEFNAASEGTWQVTVNPGAGWRVLSLQTQQVVIDEDNQDYEEINFCIIRVPTPTPTATSQTTPTPPISTPTPIPPVLPGSGAPAAPTLVLAAAMGILFLLAGGGLFIYSRR
jgi:hypothetical protein